VERTGRIITVENHSIIGGLGSAVAEVLAETGKGRLKRLGIHDRFGEVGTIDYLLDIFGISVPHIVKAARQMRNDY
jgi:transketolase